jgi:hypothetical protein
MAIFITMIGGSQNKVDVTQAPKSTTSYTDDRGGIVLAVGSVFIVLETFAFALRALSQWLRRIPFKPVDLLATLAFLSNMGLIGMAMGT